MTGQPAISLPLFQGDDGLPLAVQLAGRPADEATLLSLGAQLEAARPGPTAGPSWRPRRERARAMAGPSIGHLAQRARQQLVGRARR